MELKELVLEEIKKNGWDSLMNDISLWALGSGLLELEIDRVKQADSSDQADTVSA